MIKYSLSIAALLFTTIGFVNTAGITIGSTLTNCKNIASQFKNTCSGAPDTPADWASFTGATVPPCSQQTCPDNG